MNGLFDPALAETRVAFGMAEAEIAQRGQWRLSAELFRAIDATLREAELHPEVFLDEQMLRGDGVELAVRAATADLAVRLNLTQSAVRNHRFVAQSLQQRLPGLWLWFVDGEVSTQNAQESAVVAVDLPERLWTTFDAEIGEPARQMAPPRFRAFARRVRDRLLRATAAERHDIAVIHRRTWSEHDRDGMSWFGAYLPSEVVALANARIDAAAFDLLKVPDETRTMSQLRADVLADLLTGATPGSKVGVTVGLTIPVLALLGHSDEPAVLEGVGPIDLDTARRLAVDAPSITRLLTDPVSGSVLYMDPKQYRPTAAMRRWFSIRHETCDFPGCGRRAMNCDLDHTIARAHNGPSSVANLAPRCRHHHTLKHQTKWQVTTPPGAQRAVWTSPTGHQREADPPPF